MAQREIEQPLSPSNLLSVVEELERSVESMTTALVQVRSAIRALSETGQLPGSAGLALVVPSAVADGPLSLVSAPAESPAAAEGVAAAENEARDAVRRPVEQARKELSWAAIPVDAGLSFPAPGAPPANRPAPVSQEPAFGAGGGQAAAPVEITPVAAVQTDEEREARREAVRRSVEAAREEMWGPTVAAHEPAAEAASGQDDEDARREAVRRAVQAARGEMWASPEAATDTPGEDGEEARREAVRLTVEAARLESQRQAGQEAVQDDEDARREAVRRAVEDTRNRMSWGQMKMDGGGDWGQLEPEPGGFTLRSDQIAPAPPPIRESVAESAAPSKPQSAPQDDEEARREAVRQAVDAARLEMMQDDAAARPRIVPVVPPPGSTPPGADFSGPPMIVIEDPLGRVELAQVYATLTRIDSSGQAALLNYSPHSVTIGLPVTARIPTPEQLMQAAQTVFGRECTVRTVGTRTAIEIGSNRWKAS